MRDAWRPRFIVSHLAQIRRAISSGVDAGSYLHWNLIDASRPLALG